MRCWGHYLQFFCLDRPSLPIPLTLRSYCRFHSHTPQPHCQTLQLSCHSSHPVVSHHLLVHPHCQSLHLHCQSLCLPHHLSHHLPGIQYWPCCHSQSQRPGLILSGSHLSRRWLQNLNVMHCINATVRSSWTRNRNFMASTSGSQALLTQQSGQGRLTCQNCCHLFFPCEQVVEFPHQ